MQSFLESIHSYILLIVPPFCFYGESLKSFCVKMLYNKKSPALSEFCTSKTIAYQIRVYYNYLQHSDWLSNKNKSNKRKNLIPQ